MRFSRPALFVAGIATALAGTAIAESQTLESFSDVVRGTFYAPSVETLARKGVISGYDDGRFGPDDPVTRGQVAVMIDRYDERNIEPLRQQMEQIRKELNLGYCGDSKIQLGEECDDGNTRDGDGCSDECTLEAKPRHCPHGETYSPDGCNTCHCMGNGQYGCTKMACPPGGTGYCTPGETKKADCNICVCNEDGEFECTLRECGEPKQCPGGYKPGQKFKAPDGCNTCYCEESGAVSCTEMACEQPEKYCYSSSDCPSGQICSVEQGDCRSNCKEGQPCAAVCVGVCNPLSASLCGNGICEPGEGNVSDPGGCGPNADPSCLGPPASFTKGTCPQDCSDAYSCEEYEQKYDNVLKAPQKCKTDSDCTLFSYSCPYLTCGEAVTTSAKKSLQSIAPALIKACEAEGKIYPCAGCLEGTVSCAQNECVFEH